MTERPATLSRRSVWSSRVKFGLGRHDEMSWAFGEEEVNV